ncbi:MAG: alpha/beta hydrolase [Bacteroidia bacterium]|nr:alpha/beta hydrolase [Bacteroidia bacterium]
MFVNLNLSDYHAHFIKWIEPLPEERLEDYAKRLLSQITTNSKPTLIGLSFGGVMAIEVSKLIAYENIILISSFKTTTELPWYFRLAALLKLDVLVPASLLKKSGPINYWLFGVDEAAEKKLLQNILEDTSPLFLKWAIHQLLNWKNKTVPERIYHIHGNKDRLLPIKYLRCDKAVLNGGHFMILNKADEINDLLRQATLLSDGTK